MVISGFIPAIISFDKELSALRFYLNRALRIYTLRRCRVLAQPRQNAQQWREDPVTAAEIEGRLKQYSFDAVAINAEVYVQAERQVEMFKNLMQGAHQRRIVLL
jgi:hypothetical protein